MRFRLAAIAAAALLAGCGGGGESFEPVEPDRGPDVSVGESTPDGLREGEKRVTVVAPHRFVDVVWESDGESGSAELVSRAGPDRDGLWRFAFNFEPPRGAPASVTATGMLPFESVVAGTLPPDASSITARLDAEVRGCSPANPADCAGPPAATGDGDGVVWVSAEGEPGAAGTTGEPLATVDEALQRSDTRVVYVESGEYPAFNDAQERDEPVVVRGVGDSRPRFAGAGLTGSGLQLDNLAFDGGVAIGAENGDGAEDIVISDSELTTRQQSNCLSILPGSARIEIRGSWVHDCYYGITTSFSGDPDGPTVDEVRVHGNLLERFIGDGVQMSDWQDSAVERNLIREMDAGEADDHNDGVQIVGGVSNLRIAANEIHTSRHQLILIQDYLAGPTTNVRVENNLLWGAGAWAAGNYGGENVSFVNNTAWGNAAGGLILGGRRGGGPPAGDTLVANNVLDVFYLQNGAVPREQTGNVFGSVSALGDGELETQTPGFTSLPRHDYRPIASAEVRGTASADLLPDRDLLGLPRSGEPTAGAFG